MLVGQQIQRLPKYEGSHKSLYKVFSMASMLIRLTLDCFDMLCFQLRLCLFLSLSVFVFVCVPHSISVCLCLSVSTSDCLNLSPVCVSLPLCLSGRLSSVRLLCLAVWMFVCVSLCPCVCLSVWFPVYLFICCIVCLSPSVSLSVCLVALLECLSLHLSFCRSVCPSRMSISSFCLFGCLSRGLLVHLSLCAFVCVSILLLIKLHTYITCRIISMDYCILIMIL